MTIDLNIYNHYWRYCGHCERDVVICGLCKNNSCNGGYGEINNQPCKACPSAYEMQSNKDKLASKSLAYEIDTPYIVDTGFK